MFVSIPETSLTTTQLARIAIPRGHAELEALKSQCDSAPSFILRASKRLKTMRKQQIWRRYITSAQRTGLLKQSLIAFSRKWAEMATLWRFATVTAVPSNKKKFYSTVGPQTIKSGGQHVGKINNCIKRREAEKLLFVLKIKGDVFRNQYVLNWLYL